MFNRESELLPLGIVPSATPLLLTRSALAVIPFQTPRQPSKLDPSLRHVNILVKISRCGSDLTRTTREKARAIIPVYISVVSNARFESVNPVNKRGVAVFRLR